MLTGACGKKHNRVARAPSSPQSRASSNASRNTQPPLAVSLGYTEQGLASWYGIPYHGRPAADGEIYDMETLVAAHRLMPFNTWLKVTNLSNNQFVTVRVIDRGPFVEGRIIDLSKAAARQIGLLGPGVGNVRIEVVAAPPDVPSNDFYAVQVGAFAVQANAERARLAYAARFGFAQLALKQGRVPLYRVLVGKEPSVASAQNLANSLVAENKDVFVVRLDESSSHPPAIVSDDPTVAPAAPAQTQSAPTPTAPAATTPGQTTPAPDPER